MHRPGGCLCGAVRFELRADPEFVEYCHCENCRRSVGAPVMVWALAARDDFRLCRGQPVGYESTDGVTRSFCDRCGSSLTYFSRGDSARIAIAVATFDDPSLLPPDVHIWRCERLPWFETGDDLPRYVRFKFEGLKE